MSVVLIITLTLFVFTLVSIYWSKILSSDCCLVDKERVSGIFETVFWDEISLGCDWLVEPEFELPLKIFWIDSMGLKFEISSFIVFWDDSFASEISLDNLSPTSLISLDIDSLVLSTILSIDESILCSTES